MSWAELVAIIRQESGAADLAAKIEARILRDLAGVRLSIPAKEKPLLTPAAIHAAMTASGWSVEKAAARLGVDRSTLYRHLNRLRGKQSAKRTPPRHRLVR